MAVWGVCVVAVWVRMGVAFVCERFFCGWMVFSEFGSQFFGRGVFGRVFEFFTRLGGFSNGGFIIMNCGLS